MCSTSDFHLRRAACALGLGLAGLVQACGPEDSGNEEPPEASGIVTDANNFQSTTVLTIPTAEVKAGSELSICWDAVTNDVQCQDIQPLQGIDNVAFIHVPAQDHATVAQKLALGTLPTTEVKQYFRVPSDYVTACTTLTAMSSYGLGQEYVQPPLHLAENPADTYMLLFSKGSEPGLGTRSMTFVRPLAASSNTMVQAQPGCPMLNFTASLSRDFVELPAAGPWVLNWAAVTVDSQQQPFPGAKVDLLQLGFIANSTVEAVEADLLHLENNATQIWELEFQGARVADLAQATERTSGAPFAGFANGQAGVWVLVLRCSACQNPTPVLLSVVQPT